MRRALAELFNRVRAVTWSLTATLLVVASAAWAGVTVSLNAPVNGSKYVPPVNITLSATASANTGYTVSKVEFFNGSTLIGTDTTSPYSIVWNNAPSGQHVITAKATAVKKNSPDQTATSTAANITVNSPPLATMTSPVDGTTYPIPPPPIAVNVTASDSDGTIVRVDFYDCAGQGQLLATRTAPPYSFTWTLPAPYWDAGGKFSMYGIRAEVFDNLGGLASSSCNSVFLAPTITLTAPANGATFNAPATIPLSATVTPSDAPITKIRFYQGTTLLGEDLSPPYSFTWQSVPVGSYSLSARAVDANELEYATTPVNVTVTAAPALAQLHFIHVDHLNTPRLVANQSGQTVWRWDQHEPFGVNVADENPSGLGAFEFPLRFPGQYFDKEANLHYNYFRDFDPSIGRYVQSDPIGLRGGLNTYLYVRAAALRYSDPLGLVSSEPSPRMGGCGPQGNWRDEFVPNNPLGFPFQPCCDAHDKCYDNCKGPDKLGCDMDTCNCLNNTCGSNQGFSQALCRQLAREYCYRLMYDPQSDEQFRKARMKCPSC